MALTGKAGYRLAGDQFADVDFDKNANLNVSKLSTRTLYKTLSMIDVVKSEVLSVTTFNGVFGGRVMRGAVAASTFVFNMPKPPEYVSGDVVAKILWSSAAAAGDLKLSIDTKSAVEGDDTSSGATDTATQTVTAPAHTLNVMSITIAAADFNVGNVLGFKLTRDPLDGADTMNGDAFVYCISFEYTGRG